MVLTQRRLLPTTGIGLIRLPALHRGTLPRLGIAYESHTHGVSGTRVSADTVDSRFTQKSDVLR
jgi:hypothetical protein